MIGRIIGAITGTGWMQTLIWAGSALMGLLVVAKLLVVYGGRLQKAKTTVDTLRGELKRHERMNDAETSNGASDADNARWLRDLSASLRKR